MPICNHCVPNFENCNLFFWYTYEYENIFEKSCVIFTDLKILFVSMKQMEKILSIFAASCGYQFQRFPSVICNRQMIKINIFLFFHMSFLLTKDKTSLSDISEYFEVNIGNFTVYLLLSERCWLKQFCPIPLRISIWKIKCRITVAIIL